ncbi:SIR2 family protein [Geomonas ferrireducens]|uniref:SIR2 family protein n=1 Tax=Geomonas ferrireducens TaxID=2570227 RepID=UPI0010A78927|nr:SIR2 family protein [Geomonas ferrireducens]
MRFLANGPSIPDELLVARDEGRVIFFCGAGVSRARAGLSDFFGLAEKVTGNLRVPAGSPIRKLISEARELDERLGISGLISADRIFGLLERDFLVREIEASVARALKPEPDVDLSAHKIILDLARFHDGKTTLVTTNFDLLFESCDTSVPYHKPPRLPDPQYTDAFEGIIHLHGHVDSEYCTSSDGFVLSSSEFGHAYLADGWATEFIRSVLERYTVVFIGYAADDPPVLYLLEALNRHSNASYVMYAFQAGSPDTAEAKWRHKGVTPIPYEEAGGHKSLWETLGAWATRAKNPDQWYEDVIDMARKGPEELLPHERGQVAHVVSTLAGAKKFASSENPPPAAWLCVFDPLLRYLKPGYLGSYIDRGPYFDPFQAFGLDSDPRPSEIDPEDYGAKREVPKGVWDCFAITKPDRQDLGEGNFATLRGHYSINTAILPNRLRQIGLWIGAVSYQPAAPWWASHQTGIHPDIQRHVRYELERRKLDSTPEVRRAWRYIFAGWKSPKKNYHDWFQLKPSIDLDGWSDAAVREVALIWRPYLSIGWPYSSGPKPPSTTEDIDFRHLVNATVEYPDFHETLEIPNEHLLTIVREFRKNLEYSVSLEKELDTLCFLSLCPIEADPDLEGESSERHYGLSRLFLFYVELVDRLTRLDPKAAKREALAWWQEDEKIFARLRIWAAGRQSLFSTIEAGEQLCSLTDEVFWDSYHQRDLMLVLSQLWNQLPVRFRKRLERRLLRGRRRWTGEKTSEHRVRRAWNILNRIHWLSDKGCKFSFDIEKESLKLQDLAPEWQQQYSAKAAASFEGRGGTVATDTDYIELLNEPLATVLDRARELSGRFSERLVTKDPFAGLAAERPIRAFLALKFSAKKSGEMQEWAWKKFLFSPAREHDRPRFSALIARRLAAAGANAIAGLTYAISDWFVKSCQTLFSRDQEGFEQLWSKILNVLGINVAVAKTALVGGNKERAWATEALNSPVGKLVQGIMLHPLKENLVGGKGLPCKWTSYAEDLLALPDDHRRYAIVTFTYNLSWFFFIDPEWTEKHLLSALEGDKEDLEAFWAGFFWAGKVPDISLYIRLKQALLQLALKRPLVEKREASTLPAILLAGWATLHPGTDERLITSEEMRNVLLSAGDSFREQVLWHWERWCSGGKNPAWKATLPLFLKEVWPRQKQAKTPRTSARLCDLAFSSETDFPTIADAILPLISKIDVEEIIFPHLRGASNQIVEKYPEGTLTLLWEILPENATKWPYGLGEVLSKLGEANSSLTSDNRLALLKHRWNNR